MRSAPPAGQAGRRTGSQRASSFPLSSRMPVCPVFAVGLDGKCGTGEQRLQGGPDRDRLPAAAAPVGGTIDSPDIWSTSASRQKWSVANSAGGEPDCSVVINNTLAIERRGGRGGAEVPMLVRSVRRDQRPWNKGLLIGQKNPLEPKHVWSIRVRLEIARARRDLVIFNLAIDSKLRACDLVKLRLDDICSGAKVRHRATIVQKKTGRPVQFEITEQSRSSVEAWLPMLGTTGSRYLFPSRLHARPHTSPRQYARLVHRWVESIGLESASYGTHSMRRTKAIQIYRKTGNLRAVQLLLGHTKLESTVRYLGIEVDDALNIAEQIEL